MKTSEILALISLLDDEDQEVVAHVSDKIKSYGKSIVPALEEIWSPDFSNIQSERLEQLIHEIQLSDLLLEIQSWNESPTRDLLSGYFLVSKYFYPDLDFETVERKVQKIRQKIWIELNYNQTPFEQVQIFNQVFYYHLGFLGDQNASSNFDFCLNHLLDTKKGNPISLGLLYIILANSLQLPIYGVRLISYFILAFCKTDSIVFDDDLDTSDHVLFYLNPFQKGIIFSKHQIDDYLKRMKMPQRPLYYSPASTNQVLVELLDYLIFLTEQRDQSDIQYDLLEMKKMFSRI